MTITEKAALQIAVLQVLRTKAELGMPEAALLAALRGLAHDVTLPVLQVELRSLGDRNLISSFAPLGGTRHRITALGESHLAEAGL